MTAPTVTETHLQVTALGGHLQGGGPLLKVCSTSHSLALPLRAQQIRTPHTSIKRTRRYQTYIRRTVGAKNQCIARANPKAEKWTHFGGRVLRNHG